MLAPLPKRWVANRFASTRLGCHSTHWLANGCLRFPRAHEASWFVSNQLTGVVSVQQPRVRSGLLATAAKVLASRLTTATKRLAGARGLRLDRAILPLSRGGKMRLTLALTCALTVGRRWRQRSGREFLADFLRTKISSSTTDGAARLRHGFIGAR
jgi:hypothetical protein